MGLSHNSSATSRILGGSAFVHWLAFFNLESHIGQGKALGQDGLDLSGDLLGLVQGGVTGQNDVSGAGWHVGGQVQQVQVMDVHHLLGLPDCGQDGLGVQTSGDAFHQDVGGHAQQSPPGPQDQRKLVVTPDLEKPSGNCGLLSRQRGSSYGQ